MTIIKNEIIDIIIMELARAINQSIARLVNVFVQQTLPLIICKGYLIQTFNLNSKVFKQSFWSGHIG